MKKSALVTVFSIVMFALLALPAQADYLYDRSGTLVPLDGAVLGEDSATPTKVSPPSDRSEAARKRAEQIREKAKQQLEQQIETRQKLNEKNQLKSRLEINTEEGKFKLKQETIDRTGRTTNKEVELEAGESVHVENKSGERTEIKPIIMELKEQQQTERKEMIEEKREERAENREQKLEIIRNQVKTETKLPLRVSEDNELMVTRPDGTTKVVTVLPDQAVENLRKRGIVLEETGSAPELVENSSGDLVYRLERDEERRILGLRLKFRRATEVSAETGEVTTTSQETNTVKKWLERFVF